MTSVLDLIGATPMVEVTRMDRGPCRLFLKLESANPSGSIKDRPARAMIEAAENEGKLKPGGTIVEATAGNTGLGLALVGGRKGYRTLLVVPDKMAREKVLHARAMGAQVVITRSDVGKGHPDYYQDLAQAIARRTPDAFFINQFANPANPHAHASTTGPEILAQDGGQRRCRCRRRRLRRYPHRRGALHAPGLTGDGDDPCRSGRLGARAPR
jgi:cystathionine beta-synthase